MKISAFLSLLAVKHQRHHQRLSYLFIMDGDTRYDNDSYSLPVLVIANDQCNINASNYYNSELF